MDQRPLAVPGIVALGPRGPLSAARFNGARSEDIVYILRHYRFPADEHIGVAHVLQALIQLREEPLLGKVQAADEGKPHEPAVRMPREHEIDIPVLVILYLILELIGRRPVAEEDLE